MNFLRSLLGLNASDDQNQIDSQLAKSLQDGINARNAQSIKKKQLEESTKQLLIENVQRGWYYFYKDSKKILDTVVQMLPAGTLEIKEVSEINTSWPSSDNIVGRAEMGLDLMQGDRLFVGIVYLHFEGYGNTQSGLHVSNLEYEEYGQVSRRLRSVRNMDEVREFVKRSYLSKFS